MQFVHRKLVRDSWGLIREALADQWGLDISWGYKLLFRCRGQQDFTIPEQNMFAHTTPAHMTYAHKETRPQRIELDWTPTHDDISPRNSNPQTTNHHPLTESPFSARISSTARVVREIFKIHSGPNFTLFFHNFDFLIIYPIWRIFLSHFQRKFKPYHTKHLALAVKCFPLK